MDRAQVFHGAITQLSAGLYSSQGSAVAGDYAFSFTQVAIGRRLQFFAMWASPKNCSQHGFLQSK